MESRRKFVDKKNGWSNLTSRYEEDRGGEKSKPKFLKAKATPLINSLPFC